MRAWLRLTVLAAALMGAAAFPVATMAQQSVPFRTLDQDRLLSDSRLGQQVIAAIEQRVQALDAENQRIFDELAAEEAALTQARDGLSAEEFRTRADAFDARVEAIRAERRQRIQDLAEQNDRERQQFFDSVVPVVDQIMAEQGIVALLYPDVIIRGDFRLLDLTADVITRLDDSTPPQQP